MYVCIPGATRSIATVANCVAEAPYFRQVCRNVQLCSDSAPPHLTCQCWYFPTSNASTFVQVNPDTSTNVRQHLHLLRRTRRHRHSRCTPPPAATRAERRLRTLYRCPTASSARGKPDRRSCRPDRRKSCSRSRLRLLPRTASQAPRNSGNLQSRL